ncbi:MAG: glycosyltransferase family A protein, partial [Syntrophales bacterium]
AQSIRNVRVLIIDDASPDNTAEVGSDLAKEDSRVTFLRHTTNKGHITTYNEGIDWASADYFLLLSADDYLLPGALRRAVTLMDEHSEVGFTFGKAVELADSSTLGQTMRVTDPPSEIMSWRILQGQEFIRLIELSGSINIVPTPTVVVRTALQKQLGRYRSELPHSGDMEMWLRFAAHSSVGTLDAYQAVWRRHGGNMQLAYYRHKGLSDLQQRKQALDCFLDTCRHTRQDIPQIYRRLLKPLSKEAVQRASSAFNDNEIELSEQLSEFALSVWPEVWRTFPWFILVSKKLIGVRGSRALAPAVAEIRQAASKLFSQGGKYKWDEHE